MVTLGDINDVSLILPIGNRLQVEDTPMSTVRRSHCHKTKPTSSMPWFRTTGNWMMKCRRYINHWWTHIMGISIKSLEKRENFLSPIVCTPSPSVIYCGLLIYSDEEQFKVGKLQMNFIWQMDLEIFSSLYVTYSVY